MTKIPNKNRYESFVLIIVILVIGICLPLASLGILPVPNVYEG